MTIGGFVEKEQGYFYNENIFKVFNLPYSQNYRFPRKIDLTAIEVGDWDVNAQTEAAGFLEASHPFDARVYLDLDNRLSRQGYTHRANDVYRAMAKKNREFLKKSDDPRAKWHAGLSALNYFLPGNGTVIFPMVFGLICTIIFVAYLLSLPSNIEPVEKGTDQLVARQWSFVKALGLAFGHAVPGYKPVPDIAKARLTGPTCLGSAVEANLDSSEAKFDGKPMEGQATKGGGVRMVIELKRLEFPLVQLNSQHKPIQLETTSNSIDVSKTSEAADKNPGPACQSLKLLISPHNSAEYMSMFQLVLWSVLAANLPSIMRKRG